MDTSGLLNAWQRNYPPDVFPTLWENLDGLIRDGIVIATEEVLIELEKKEGDVVHDWAKQRPAMFVPIDEQIQRVVSTILQNYPRLIDNRTNRSGADPFVIALAIVQRCTVVTGEHPSRSPVRPKIPDVCTGMNVRCIGMVDLIREQNWRL